MKYKIIFILILIVLAIFLASQVYGESGQLGISEPNCKSDFKSAGVYDETLGIYSLTCVAKVSPEYNCQKWQFIIGKGFKCLR